MIQAKSKINDKIEALEQQLLSVKGRETEQYARIVGYYRAVKNWNKGKKEEYKFRVNFSNTEFNKETNGTVEQKNSVKQQAESEISTNKIVKYMFFYRTTCPNCPPVKAIIDSLEIDGESVNADSSNGFTKAAKHGIFTAPTVLFLDSDGVEVSRTSKPSDLKKLLSESKII